MSAPARPHADFYVDPIGHVRNHCPWRESAALTRATREAAAMNAILTSAIPPDACGPAIPVAPARGPMQSFMPREVVQTEAGNWRGRNAGYMGRRAARVSDTFDMMTFQAQRAHASKVRKAEKAGRDAPVFLPLFTHGQVSAARDYAALTERVEASGVKCSSLEALGAASGGGGDREAAIFRDFQRLRALHARIGNGLAKDVRRIRPGKDKRSAIRLRALVDLVCLGDMSLSGVLGRFGWSKDEKSLEGLRRALCAALDRMQGYDLAMPQNVG